MTETQKKKRKPLKIVLIVTACVVGFVLLVLLGARIYFRAPISDYYANSEKAFVIPELNSGMIMQGICYNETDDVFLISGYRSGDASLISVVKKSDGSHVKTIELKNSDGSDYTGHVGGIAVNGDFLYIANGGKSSVDVFSYGELASAETGESVAMKGRVSFTTDDDSLNPAFVTLFDNCLVVGEFYRNPGYETNASHHLTVNGGENHALAVCFKLSDSAEFGFETTPSAAYSIPDKAQGMAFYNGKALVSTSYGPSFSYVYAYDLSEATSLGAKNILGTETEVFAFDNDNLSATMKIAPMAEEIEVVDGKMYTMCESATNKYIFGKFTSAKFCYATDLSKYIR